MAINRAATPLRLRDSDVSAVLKIMNGKVFVPTGSPGLLQIVQKVTGKKPVGPTAKYDDHIWEQLVVALHDKLYKWRPAIQEHKKTKKVFKYDKTTGVQSISRTAHYQDPLVDLILYFPLPPTLGLPADPDPSETEASSARAPLAAPTPAPWARSGASSAGPFSAQPSQGELAVDAEAASTSPNAGPDQDGAPALAPPPDAPPPQPPGLDEGDPARNLTTPLTSLTSLTTLATPLATPTAATAPLATPTASAAALWLGPAAATTTPAAPAEAEEPEPTPEQPSEVEDQRLEIERLKGENQRLKLEKKRDARNAEMRIGELKRKLEYARYLMAQCLSQTLDESDAEQEDMDADGNASEPDQTVATTSSVRDPVLWAGGSATPWGNDHTVWPDLPQPGEPTWGRDPTVSPQRFWIGDLRQPGEPTRGGDPTVWPEGFAVRDLLQAGTQDEQARLAPLIKQMTLGQDVERSYFQGYFHNRDVEVGSVWLGRLRDGVTPLATVAFRTLQDALRVKDMVRSGDVADLVSGLFDWVPTDRSASRRRLFFKNSFLATFGASVLEQHLARKYGPGVSVQPNSFWDGRGHKRQHAPTDIILSGCVEFAEESHADALWADLEPVRNSEASRNDEDMMVLKYIPGIVTPISFKRDRGYENRGS